MVITRDFVLVPYTIWGWRPRFKVPLFLYGGFHEGILCRHSIYYVVTRRSGGGGIRTHEPFGSRLFKSLAFVHSATPPEVYSHSFLLGYSKVPPSFTTSSYFTTRSRLRPTAHWEMSQVPYLPSAIGSDDIYIIAAVKSYNRTIQ